MINTFELSYEYLDKVKELLLKDVPTEDQSRLMIGFLDEVDSWIRLKDAKYGYEEAVQFRDDEIKMFMEEYADADSQLKMEIFVQDNNIKTLWKIAGYLWDLKENKKRLSISSCKSFWRFSVYTFAKCEPHIRGKKISAIQSICHAITENRPSTSAYIWSEYRKLIKGFNHIPWDLNCNDDVYIGLWDVITGIILAPFYLVRNVSVYVLMKIL